MAVYYTHNNMRPNEWASSIRCLAKLDVLLLLRKVVLYFLYRVENRLPVCPTYVLWQSGQVDLCTPDKENLSGAWSLWVSKLPKLYIVSQHCNFFFNIRK